MKKFNLLFLGLLAIAAVFVTSCDGTDEEDHAAPTVTIDNAAATIEANESIAFTGTVTTLGELAEVKFFVDGPLFGDAVTSFDNTASYTFRVLVDSMVATYDFKVRATDELGQETEVSVTMTIDDTPALTIVEYTDVKMYAQDAANNMCFDASTGSVGTPSMTADDIDLVLLYNNGASIAHGLYAPSDSYVGTLAAYGSWDWSGTHNATAVTKTTMSFDATAEEIDAMSVSGTSAAVLVVGDILAFETVDGYKGLIKVTASALSKDIMSDANVTFDAKVVAPAGSAK